jgi:hypothetical protein
MSAVWISLNASLLTLVSTLKPRLIGSGQVFVPCILQGHLEINILTGYNGRTI